MNMLKHNDYIARVEFDDEDRIFVGRLVGIDSIVTFHGSTVDELEAAFHEAVDHYVVVRERTGRPVQKPYSGKFVMRVDPKIHSHIAAAAELQGVSLNQWASDVLSHSAIHALKTDLNPGTATKPRRKKAAS